ncbi:hypothetical protein TNCT_183371 [Trichonephila clavata]|uniref:Uncharacterized protein n=1 Tax=Trichonephila clavata TaxID=2740835 RepID=A0A8X6HMW9_TRICU|nr:hypothetical protein TNCT_183371 [Trichonephila clavata]
MIPREVAPLSLRSCIDSSMERRPRVFCHFDLKCSASKQTHHENRLRRLALEIINCISEEAVQVYTGGNHTEDRIGSGIFIDSPPLKTTIKARNPDTCFVFRSELIAINIGLDVIISYD